MWWKYPTTMISINYFLSEFEEMKSCVNRVETANAGKRLYWLCRHLLVLPLEKTGSTERVCKTSIVPKFSKHYPTLTLQFAGLRKYKGIGDIAKGWNIVWSNWTTSPIVDLRHMVGSLLDRNIIHSRFFFPTAPILSTATKDSRSPNTMNSQRLSEEK